MKIKDLIKKLQKMDLDSQVVDTMIYEEDVKDISLVRNGKEPTQNEIIRIFSDLDSVQDWPREDSVIFSLEMLEEGCI